MDPAGVDGLDDAADEAVSERKAPEPFSVPDEVPERQGIETPPTTASPPNREAPITTELPGRVIPGGAPEPVVQQEGPTVPAAEDVPPGVVAPESIEVGGELEEIALPSSIVTLDPLPPGTTVGPDGYIVVDSLEEQGRVNRYRAIGKPGQGESVALDLLEGPLESGELERQAEVLSAVEYSMLPGLYATWEQDGRHYLATDHVDGPSLRDVLVAGINVDELISVAVQLAQVSRRLHSAGWALAGLSPDDVRMGRPICVAHLEGVMRLGERPEHALQIPGYSAPELAAPAPVTGKEDVYTLGAILYHGFAGVPLSEQGAEGGFSDRIRVPGVPQLLGAALAPAAERVDIDELYRMLLALKGRLSARPLSIEVASGSSIGLNETRTTNEDACGHLTWSSAYEGRVASSAVLCVVDGMGGMEAGEVLSTAALRAVLIESAGYAARQSRAAGGSDREEETTSEPSGSQHLSPTALVKAAAEAAYDAGRGREGGATITCVVIENDLLTLGHVGDTRAYLARGGILTQLTRDHSLVAAMVASGMLTKEEARGHPESNKVLRSLGGQRTLPDQYVDGLMVAYGMEALPLRPDDQLLLCSDGVWGVVDDERLLRILLESPRCDLAVNAVIAAAIDAGAPDNVSAVIARCGSR